MDDKLIAFGEALKVLSRTDDNVTVGGYLVRFSTDADPDLTGEFFTKSTRFDVEDGDTRPAYYHHGLDRTIKTRVLGRGTMRIDDVGVWAETQIRLADDYAREIAGLVEAGKLGYSSGAVSHLVEKEEAGKAVMIKTWPIGEISLTPTPAEPRNIVALKSLLPTPDPDPVTQTISKMETVQQTPDIKGMIADAVKAAVDAMQPAPQNPNLALPAAAKAAPAFIEKTGDSPAKALMAYVRRGDLGGVKAYQGNDGFIEISEMFKSSNDSTMNITTSGAGAATVPTDHYGRIIARRNEIALFSALGVTNIPGKGTTVEVPVESDDANIWVQTNESGSYDRDRPVVQKVNFTLVKYTKRVELTEELMEDEDSGLMGFIENNVGRGLALLENNLLVTEVAANGANLGAFNQTAIVANQLETGVFGTNIAYYLNRGDFIMRPPTYASIIGITGNDRLYVPTAQGTGASLTPSILGYPVRWSNEVAAIGSGNRSVLFGNFEFVGRREAGMSVLLDPYSASTTGITRLLYRTRLVYKVLQSQAVGAFRHATA